MTINEEILYIKKNMHSTNYKNIQIMTMQYQIPYQALRVIM